MASFYSFHLFMEPSSSASDSSSGEPHRQFLYFQEDQIDGYVHTVTIVKEALGELDALCIQDKFIIVVSPTSLGAFCISNALSTAKIHHGLFYGKQGKHLSLSRWTDSIKEKRVLVLTTGLLLLKFRHRFFTTSQCHLVIMHRIEFQVKHSTCAMLQAEFFSSANVRMIYFAPVGTLRYDSDHPSSVVLASTIRDKNLSVVNGDEPSSAVMPSIDVVTTAATPNATLGDFSSYLTARIPAQVRKWVTEASQVWISLGTQFASSYWSQVESELQFQQEATSKIDDSAMSALFTQSRAIIASIRARISKATDQSSFMTSEAFQTLMSNVKDLDSSAGDKMNWIIATRHGSVARELAKQFSKVLGRSVSIACVAGSINSSKKNLDGLKKFLGGHAAILVTTYDALRWIPVLGASRAIIGMDPLRNVVEYGEFLERAKSFQKAILVTRKASRVSETMKRLLSSKQAPASASSEPRLITPSEKSPVDHPQHEKSESYLLDLLHRFASSIPHDAFWSPKLRTSVERVEGQFRCSVSLPSLVPAGTFVGALVDTEKGAVLSALRAAYKVLRERNFIDELHRPTHFKAPELGLAHQGDSDYDRKLIRQYEPIHSWPSSGGSTLGAFFKYYITIEGDPSCRGVSVCLLSDGELYAPLPPITLRTYHATSQAHIRPSGQIYLTPEQVQRLQQAHMGFFREILPLSADIKWTDCHRKYLVAPAMASNETEIDWDAVAYLAGAPREPQFFTTTGNFDTDSERLRDSILIAKHNNTRFVGVDLHQDITPESPRRPSIDCFQIPLPDGTFPKLPEGWKGTWHVASNGEFYSYIDYFRDKYEIQLKNPKQNLISVRPFSIRALNPFKELPKPSGLAPTMTHVPELLEMHPWSWKTFQLAKFIPAILYRIEGFQRAVHLRDRIGILEIPVETMQEAITGPTAGETYSYEQLECYGDCYLKFVACTSTFSKFPYKFSEQLESFKHKMVSNKTLYERAESFELARYLIANPFRFDLWFPPGFPHPPSAPETFKLSDKGVADMVEAILGAAYRAGGSQLCDKALTKFGMGSLVALELTRDVASVDEISGTTFQEFESNIEQVEAMLKYKFLAPQLCLQALIHPSFESLPSSSRLQFVGDAALDILVTERHILHNFPSLSPGEITDLRSAIVNHANLTMVAFRMGLDQVIIHKSNTLQRSIQLYKAKVDTNRFCKDYEYVDIWSTDDPRPVGDALEALIGAVLIDSNGDLGRVWEVFGPILQPSLDFYATPHKSTAVPLREMYEIAQKKACKQVKVSERPLTLVKLKYAEVTIHGNKLGFGIASNKKAAKTVAAASCVKVLRADDFWKTTCSCPKPATKSGGEKAATDQTPK